MTEQLRGFAFPFRVTAAGGVALAEGPDKLRQNIVQLLLTDIGERTMRRDYGGGLRAIVHDPNNDALRALVQHQIARALLRWEPHAQLQQMSIDPHAEPGTLWANLAYISRPALMPTSVRVPIGVGGL